MTFVYCGCVMYRQPENRTLTRCRRFNDLLGWSKSFNYVANFWNNLQERGRENLFKNSIRVVIEIALDFHCTEAVVMDAIKFEKKKQLQRVRVDKLAKGL